MPEAGKYGIVYADPPWRYDMKRGNGVAENHYPTMSIEEICALPVADIAAKDSALFLWATFPQLNEAFRVMEAWGFKYKTLAFLWLKQNRKADSWFYGMGFWTRSNAEVCCSMWEITNWWIPAHWRFGCPLVASKHTSAFDRVQNPIQIGRAHV